MTAFDLGTKSNNMMNAWRKLVAAVIKFNRKVYDKKEVIDALIDAEKIIGNVTFQQHGYEEQSHGFESEHSSHNKNNKNRPSTSKEEKETDYDKKDSDKQRGETKEEEDSIGVA